MDGEELQRRYDAGERDFTAVNLAKAKLWGANLGGANLANANLTRANLSGANLKDANLRGAKLKYIKIYGANLARACYDNSTHFAPNFNPIANKMQKF